MDAVKQQSKVRRSFSGALGPTGDALGKKEKIWVAVRIRPLLELEQLARERVAWKAEGSNTLQHVDPDKPAAVCPSYQYNRVFSETCSSQQVYEDAAQSLVEASMRGYNSTIFAYGQTGSGKTYTMQAIMALATKEVFQLIAEDASREFIIRMAAVEIYNEVVRDLLRDNSPALKLLDDPVKGTVADDLSEAGVQSVQHLQQLLAEVESRRQTRATRMNDNSSRSHEIVRLYIESRPTILAGDDAEQSDLLPGQVPDAQNAADAAADSYPRVTTAAAVTIASINFVDLAGSERASQTAEVGDKEKLRQKEASNINRSLLTLSSVIRALSDNPGKRHVPYRDSKLTRLLQSSLSGNAHMAIITTISPAAGSVDNTKAALHFATAAGRVVMKPQVNQVASNKAVIKAMAAEIQQLKVQLAAMDGNQLETALKQKEAEAAATAQERDTLRNKLQLLQNQILRGDGTPKKLRMSLDCNGPIWHNRVAVARELRASAVGVRASWAPGDTQCSRSNRNASRPSTSGGGGRPSSAGMQQLLADVAGNNSSQVRRSMRLLDCYLPRTGPDSYSRPSSSAGRGQQQQLLLNQQPTQHSQQQLHRQRSRQQRQQQGRQFPGTSILERAVSQQQEAAEADVQQQTGAGQQGNRSRLNPARHRAEDGHRALQMRKLQEPSGPEAEAAMAGLEVEARCYKHVQDYTLDELVAALEHLECQQAAGEGLGSWSDEQLDALRTEVARKQAAEALTKLGDQALDALTRKVNSYTSSADNSPFGDLRRQLADASSRDASMLDAPAVAAALASAAAVSMASWRDEQEQQPTVDMPVRTEQETGSWPEVGPRLMSGRVTPTSAPRRSTGRPASLTVPSATVTPDASILAAGAGAASRQAIMSPSDGSSSGASDCTGSRQSAASPAGSAAVTAQEQLVRMQEAWRESVEKDVSCLREVLSQYKEQVERLEMQKKLLLSQVLKLEFSLEEEENRVQDLQQQLQQTQRERDAARTASAAGAASGAAATAATTTATGDTPAGPCIGGPGNLPAINTSPPLHNNLGIFDACSDDGWASTPTADSLLPKIVALWEELYVPLAYRSRFFLSFRGREVFYYEVEARRLEWKRSQMMHGATEEPSLTGGWPDPHLARGSCGASAMGDAGPPGTPTHGRGSAGASTPRQLTSASAQAALTASSSFTGTRRRSKQLDKAARALDWERKSLAAGLKWNLTETEREELYRAWGVDQDTKERKLQLVFKLWSKETLQQPDGMARSAELVVMLCGMDASEHMMELVFGGHLREHSAAGPLNRSSSSGLGLAVSNIVRRLAPPLARAGMGTSPMRSSVSVGGGLAGGYGPHRAGGSFSSRLQSGFLSLLSSKDRPEHLGGLGGNVQSREGSFSSLASSQAVPYRRT